MIEIIYGAKGSGKTKQIIDRANADYNTAKGNIVFLSDTNRYMYDVKSRIRFLNTGEFMVESAEALAAFICGIIGGDSDTETFYIDGIARITKLELPKLKDFFEKLEKIATTFDVKFVLTISCDKENLPPHISKWLNE